MTSVSDVTAGGGSLTKTLGGGAVMGKDDFLQLLVAQLQNQDPLNPQDPTEFTAQLAQFSSLEQQFISNEKLDTIAASSGDMERLSALNMIGQEVVSTSGVFSLGEENVDLGYRIASSADEVSLNVLDADGEVKATIDADGTSRGEHFLSWDGTGLDGERLPPGEYFLSVQASAGEDSEEIVAGPLVRGTVSGVELDSSGSLLSSSAGLFRLKDILRVGEL